MSPSYFHKMPNSCESFLIANQFFYVTDDQKHCLKIISRTLSEVKKSDKFEFNNQSIVAQFPFNGRDEVIHRIYIMGNDNSDPHPEKTGNKSFNMAKSVNDLKINTPSVDACLIITSLGVYKVSLK